MKQAMTPEHKKQYEEMKKNLVALGSREGNFIKVELLFYEAMTIARAYGDNENENGLLAAFKHLQSHQYQETKALFRKNTQREQVIRRFCNSLKSVLTAGIKNQFLQPALS